MHTLYYYHDPMCSWCWGYRPTAERLFASLPAGIRLRKVLGGLAPDTNEPMPQQLLDTLPDTWRRIQTLLGVEFNFAFWTDCKPRRSTYPSCRAVIAAGQQNRADEMIHAVQRAYYLRAMNPSDVETLLLLADELQLDVAQFRLDLVSPGTEKDLQQQIAFYRQSPIHGFPSLALELGAELLPVTQDYQSHTATLDHIAQLLSGTRQGD